MQNDAQGSYNSLYNDAESALHFAIFCFILDFLGLFLGYSIFYGLVNWIQLFFHFVGSLLMSWWLIEAWGASSLWSIVLVGNLPPMLAELAVIVGGLFLKLW
jgi:hypothetical protein